MVPKKLQALLWSVKTKNLDLTRDIGYIVHQVLIYGTLIDLKWLFQTYGQARVRQEFVERPQKIYPPSAYNFAKKVLLNIAEGIAPQEKYDQTLPRRVG